MCDRKKSIVFSCITFWYSKKTKKGKKEKENIKWNIFSWRFTYNACLSAYTESNRPTRKMLPIHWRNNLNACVPATHASVPDNAGSVSFHHHDNLKFLCQCVFFFFFFLNSRHRAMFSSLFDSQLYYVIWWLYLSANTNELTLVSKLKLKSSVVVLITKF